MTVAERPEPAQLRLLSLQSAQGCSPELESGGGKVAAEPVLMQPAGRGLQVKTAQVGHLQLGGQMLPVPACMSGNS